MDVKRSAHAGRASGGPHLVRPAHSDGSFEQFYFESYPRLVRGLLSAGLTPNLAEDAAQEAMILALDRWDVIRSYNNPLAWVFRTARYKYVNSVRRELRSDSFPDDVELVAVGEDRAARVVLDLVIPEFLNHVPPRPREAMTMIMCGYTYQEVAAQLHVSQATVRQYISQARRTLKDLLADR